jgi:hypothetical protein
MAGAARGVVAGVAAALAVALACVPAAARGGEALPDGRPPWRDADRAEVRHACHLMRAGPAECDCYLEAMEPIFPGLDALRRNRDPALERALRAALRRCARLHEGGG